MEVESTYTFTDKELSELLMNAWANGWMSHSYGNKTDDGKRKYTFETIQSYHWKKSGTIVQQEAK